jgi:hypothetical protein
MSISSLPKRTHYSNGSFCDPKTEYYFVSYQVISSIKWVRMPFLTLKEVTVALESLPFLLTPGMSPSSESNLPGIIPDYENLQIYNESWLSKLHQDWDEVNQKYVDSEVTNRQVIFDNRYESAAVNFTGIPSLSRQKGEDEGAWHQRVEQHRCALKEERIARMRLYDQLSECQDVIPALLALRLVDKI